MHSHYFKNILFLLCLSLFTLTSTYAQDDLAAERNLFSRAEHALKNQDFKNYQRLAEKIQNYPLYPYLVYEELKGKIKNTKPTSLKLSEIDDFKSRYPDFPFHNALRTQWLVQMAQSKNWAAYAKGYLPSDNAELACQYYFAEYQLTKNDSYLDKAKPLWLVGYSQPAACDGLFNAWKKAGKLTSSIAFERYHLALEAKNFDLAKHLIKHLTKAEAETANTWLKMVKTPTLITQKTFLDSLKPIPAKTKQVMLAQTLKLLAKSNAEKAMSWWNAHHHDYAFTEQQAAQIKRDIGIYLSHQKSPYALDWLTELPEAEHDKVSQEWRVRNALANHDWSCALKWIDKLSSEQQADVSWQYWRARALDGLNEHQQAQAIYKTIATTRNYYGFLASLYLKQPLSLQHQTPQIPPQVAEQVQQYPGIVRFKELMLLGKISPARIEWFAAVDKMNEQEKIAAAKFAQGQELYDIAIFTMAKCEFRDDVPLRFPLAHQQDIVSNANQHNLDPAWVFAIARQESAFFTDAISPAGARGLMQLLPSTAKIMAKQYDVKFDCDTLLHTPFVNVKLGTVYLKNLKHRMYDNIILATASYNAGPGSITRWLPTQKPEEADIWIETIPYKETREYVKNVLAFTSIYRQQLGHPAGLGMMMKPIPAKESVKNS
ncbi:transglycosylase SLT domain-containing protein [Candidatus Berkiella aquae]|nr:transglycosylase SLT domain-containing protein [Candidatus Berkiella aquae]MCS5711835.1 transglycosylase SLT domain-containing protein [Candidatus Berkiella aquae]